MTDWNELIADVVAGNWKDPTTGKTATVPFEVIRIEEDLDGGEADMLAPLKLGKRLEGKVEIVEGLSGGDQVVVLSGDASHSKGAGITVEPAGGSDQPTTNPIAFVAFA